MRRSYFNKKQTPTGIEELMLSGTFLISPNPMTDNAMLEIPNFSNTGLQSRMPVITDITSKTVREIPLNEIPVNSLGNSARFSMSRGNLVAGN